ncbi:hypothetical protein EH31_09185 [Erythrobacter longus]|uniref:Heme NO-binding domain-containing protein n=2 Tax=Erythrobacter longus TaxID=1044 RepID=A0A074MEF8_ERYLO|nr:hypothetical protein EH31_09185 [Erythrobacter longus]
MYGMVNEGVRTFVIKKFGKDAWETIRLDAGIDTSQFDRMHAYDDAITCDLVAAVAKHRDMAQGEVLSVFGEYWVGYAGNSGLGNLLSLSGRNFVERVQNLDDMHDRKMMAMPGLKPPSFEIVELDQSIFELSYYSVRPGLTPMVIGLLHGLAAQTNEKISVELTSARSSANAPDLFRIELLA